MLIQAWGEKPDTILSTNRFSCGESRFATTQVRALREDGTEINSYETEEVYWAPVTEADELHPLMNRLCEAESN